MSYSKISDRNSLGENLVFLFSTERAGSTMVQMMLESHSLVYGVPEPNVLPPLKYLGYFGAYPINASYDTVNQSLGLKEFVERLPNGEEDYLEACRAYVNHLYQKVCTGHSECRYFVDKTPANVLVWDVIVKLFPRAKYIVLQRHPLAVIDSFAESFFLGDYSRMLGENTRIAEHINAVADFLASDTPKLAVTYENLVADPDKEARRILEFLGLDFEEAVIHYGAVPHAKGTMGDPIHAGQKKRPDSRHAFKWAVHFAADPHRAGIAEKILEKIPEDTLTRYGYPRASLLEPVHVFAANSAAVQAKKMKMKAKPYHFQRWIYLSLRGFSKQPGFRRFLKSLRYYCDTLLRD